MVLRAQICSFFSRKLQSHFDVCCGLISTFQSTVFPRHHRKLGRSYWIESLLTFFIFSENFVKFVTFSQQEKILSWKFGLFYGKIRLVFFKTIHFTA